MHAASVYGSLFHSSYLLLHNKLPPMLSDRKQTPFIMVPGLCWSRILAGLLWKILLLLGALTLEYALKRVQDGVHISGALTGMAGRPHS
jgi:hypothetical protein